MKIYNLFGIEIFETPDVRVGRDLDSVDLSHINLTCANLEGFDLSDAKLVGVNLAGADLYWAVFFRADLTDANLKNVILCGADLKYANFNGANLEGADFSTDKMGGPTQLQGANFVNAKIGGALFIGALYDEKTLFPRGFDPELNGLVKSLIRKLLSNTSIL